ncbi:hypothetical protein [Streptomyces sp. NPDC005533]|uniref:hypothetical protein n=1 Tax=Streptomyces sp. NPDC005533 TaxID=3364723 RepID=UPI0036A43458
MSYLNRRTAKAAGILTLACMTYLVSSPTAYADHSPSHTRQEIEAPAFSSALGALIPAAMTGQNTTIEQEVTALRSAVDAWVASLVAELPGDSTLPGLPDESVPGS